MGPVCQAAISAETTSEAGHAAELTARWDRQFTEREGKALLGQDRPAHEHVDVRAGLDARLAGPVINCRSACLK